MTPKLRDSNLLFVSQKCKIKTSRQRGKVPERVLYGVVVFVTFDDPVTIAVKVA